MTFVAESSRKSALINWYLNEIADEIETEQELTERKLLVERVINRLIYQVCSNICQTRDRVITRDFTLLRIKLSSH